MIRDEFIKQKKEKKLSARAIEKIRTMGERGYYVTEINNLTNLKRTLRFSTIVLGVLAGIVSVTLLIPFIIYRKFVATMVVPLIILGVCWALFILWFALFSPLINKKIEKHTEEYERIKQNEINKQKTIYKQINR